VTWFLRHVLDFLLVALPFLRPLRLLRAAMVWASVHRAAGRTLRGRLAVYVIGSVLLLVFVASLAVLEPIARRPATEEDFGRLPYAAAGRPACRDPAREIAIAAHAKPRITAVSTTQ